MPCFAQVFFAGILVGGIIVLAADWLVKKFGPGQPPPTPDWDHHILAYALEQIVKYEREIERIQWEGVAGDQWVVKDLQARVKELKLLRMRFLDRVE